MIVEMTHYYLLYKMVPVLNYAGCDGGYRKENQFITPSRDVAIRWATKDDLSGFETYLDPVYLERFIVENDLVKKSPPPPPSNK